MRTAYLIAVIDTRTTSPTVVGVVTRSESASEATYIESGIVYADLLFASGPTYEEALSILRRAAAGFPPLRWTLPYLDKEKARADALRGAVLHAQPKDAR